MSDHHIIPSIIDGQSTLACAHCGMLNSQIRFSRDKSCPCAPQPTAKQWYAEGGSDEEMIEIELSPENARIMSVAEMQANWLHHYTLRQMARALQN